MQKKMRYFLLAGLFLFFASTSGAWAAAICDLTQCTTESGWHIELLEVTQSTADPCSKLGIEECYRWRYKVTNSVGTTSGLTQLLFTIPSLCGEQPLLVADEVATWELIEPGVGDTTSGFGEYIKSISVARLTPNNSDGYFSFYSPEKTMTEATVGVSVKKGTGTCVIGGPSHYCSDDSDEILTVASTQIITTSDGEQYWIEENLDTQCISAAYTAISDGDGGLMPGDLLERVLIEDVFSTIGDDENKVEYVGNPNQKCNRGILKTRINSWYFISGRYVWR